MRSSSTSLRALLCVTSGALTLALGACGGSTSSGNDASETAAPAAVATPYGESSYHRHHRRHRRHGYGAIAAAASPGPSGSASAGGSWPCNNQQFLNDQRQFATGALQGDQEVDVCGTVADVRAAKTTRSGLHGYYDLTVAPSTTIEIVSDLDRMNAPPWPWVHPGDYSYVQGRYYYDSATLQGIDWTHHGTSRSWPTPGFVVVAGTEYQ